MTPLEKLGATAARLIQQAESAPAPHRIRMAEAAAAIRGAMAEIRAVLEPTRTRPGHPKRARIVGEPGTKA
ncbi:hypothetical protein [Acidocella facilis]|uniref:hypothetical protein n=1 Tax=Acidocella facilis TaxID=525 RepID=UPI001F1C3610|nr:hypothetical protein [Acidocella facilis]